MEIKLDHFIGGKFIPPATGKYLDDYNPATGEIIGQVADGNEQDVEAAVASARKAFPEWRNRRPMERGRILLKIANRMREKSSEFADLERLETGKVPFLLPIELEGAIQYWELYGGLVNAVHGEVIDLGAGLHSYTRREPFGVVGVISPWNAPLNQISRGAAPAIAAGNTVVAKPSSNTSASALEFARLVFEECGLPSGVFNVVTGSGSKVGSALVSNPGVNKVTFTGSTRAGQAVARIAAERIIPISLELGGKSPNIVFADADLGKAALGAVQAFALNAGQICSAGTRILVEESIYDQFVDAMVGVVKQLPVGRADNSMIGAIITRAQYEIVQEYFKIAESEGAVAVVGGTVTKNPELIHGWFIDPTIYTNVNNKMRIAQEEIFGPVACAIPFKDESEAIEIANDTIYGLAAGIWTRDLSRAHRVAASIDAGQININDYFAGGVETPFGGYKFSGYGREKGLEALHHFTQLKCINIRL